MENKSLKQTAQDYEPKQTLNIADLDRVDLSFPMEDRSGTSKKKNAEGIEVEEPFNYKVIVANELEYRVPNTVIEEIQKILKLRQDAKFVKVTKKGSGMNTSYSVELIEEAPVQPAA